MPNSPKEGTVWTVPVGKHNTALSKLFNNLGSQGAAIITQLDDENDPFNKKVANFMLRRGIEPSLDQRIARAIMGKNYWGPEDWVATYGGIYTKKQLKELALFPWNEEVLLSTCPLCGKTVRDCHFAHVGLEEIKGEKLSIVKFREFYPSTGQPKFYTYDNAGYSDQNLATVTMELRWYLTHIEIVPKSENKTTPEQQVMVGADYELPLAIEETVKSFHYFKKTGVRANPNRYARCKDLSSDVFRFEGGYLGSDGFSMSYSMDNVRGCHLGAGASRKYPKPISNLARPA